MPDVLTAADALKPGDHIDVLLTAPITTTSTDSDKNASSTASGLSTQTTRQNVEIYRIGTEELNNPQSQTLKSDNGSGSASPTSSSKSSNGRMSIGLLVDHQDAVVMKFIKDTGGT